jgi:betaine lipid synthase
VAGRLTLLRLCAAHLRQMKLANPNKPLVWVDIGGGTGWNIEKMDQFFPISEFDAVYLVDLCEPSVAFYKSRLRYTDMPSQIARGCAEPI